MSNEQDPRHSEYRVGIVIPTFNRGPDIDLGLTALRRQSCQSFVILVVDNSSADNTADIVASHRQSWGERLQYVRKPPQGPASARNLGLANSATELVLFLDSDVRLADDWIELALERLDQAPAVTAVGGFVVYDFDHRRINAFGGDLGYFGLAWDLCEGDSITGRETPRQRIWINCSAMMVRKTPCLSAGGFDETFFYGFEDSDLGWKLNLAGGQVWVYPDLVAYHRVSPDPGAANEIICFHGCKNRLRSLLVNASLPGLVPRLLLYLGYSLVDLVLRAPRGARLKALGWNLGRLGDTLSRRRQTQQLRRVDDGRIFALGEGRWFPRTRLAGQRRRPVPGVVTDPDAGRQPDDRV